MAGPVLIRAEIRTILPSRRVQAAIPYDERASVRRMSRFACRNAPSESKGLAWRKDLPEERLGLRLAGGNGY